ncbi:MAG TPA: SDR family oxidoreductase [Syntrophaceae bacterium]|nr:SDR family oxidoreductase [Syntrophaceae bacterium]
MQNLKDKTVLITGGSGGIGKALANSLAKEGMKLAIAARNEARLNEIAQKIRQSTSTTVLPLKADASKREDLESLVDKVMGEFGKIDVLINGVGISSQYPFWEQPLEDIENLISTNFFGYVMCTRLVLPHMIRLGGGTIINLVSGSTLVDPPPKNFLVYTSLKVGLRSFTKGLFWETRHLGIKVTSILPGVTNTALTGKLKNIDASRLMTTEAIEKAVHFALTIPIDVCPLEISVINQLSPWTIPVIPRIQPGQKVG